MPAFIWDTMKQYKTIVITMFTSAVAVGFVSVLLPYTMRDMFTALQEYQGNNKHIWPHIKNSVYIFMIVAFIECLLYRFLYYTHNVIKPRATASIKKQVFAYVQKHSHKYYSDNFAGSLSQKIRDLGFYIPRVIITFANITTTVCIFLFFSLALLKINALFASIIILWIAVHIAITALFLPHLKRLSKISSEANSEVNGKMIDSITNYANVKMFSARNNEFKLVAVYLDKTAAAIEKVRLTYWVMNALLIALYYVTMPVGLLLLQVYAISNDMITVADFIFITITLGQIYGWMFMISNELSETMQDYGTCQQALDTLNKPHSVIDKDESRTINPKDGSINIDNMTFHYSESVPLFDRFSLTIPEGQKVGVVGQSGSGKSTLSSLLLRYYDLLDGAIYIGGEDISAVTQDSLRQVITMVPQDTAMFHRSIIDNIRYGRPTATNEEVYEASKKARAHDFITKLEKGYESMVGERGIKLSVGQRQRVAIARAILKNAPVIIMDEATSALDSETETLIQDSIDNLMIGKTAIVIAHRLSTLKAMDRIVVLEDGKIIEDGSHYELLQKGGRYAHLWSMQQGGFIRPDNS